MFKTVCFTGHRDFPKEYTAPLIERLDSILERLYAADYRTFVTGGAKGFDTIAALRVLALRARRPDVRLRLSLPYERAGDGDYRRTLAGADEIEYIGREYSPDSPLARDRRMVDESNACVAFYIAGRGGGTLYTVRYANARGVPVVNIAPREQGAAPR